MDEDEEKLEEIKRAFEDKIREVKTLADMTSFIKNISPQKAKDFIKNELQEDVDGADTTITHIQDRKTFKQDLIIEIDNIKVATVSTTLDGR